MYRQRELPINESNDFVNIIIVVCKTVDSKMFPSSLQNIEAFANSN